MTYQKKELMRDEVDRLIRECRESDVAWAEMAANVHLDPRLDLESQVNVYAQVFYELEGDSIVRYQYDEDGYDKVVMIYGVD